MQSQRQVSASSLDADFGLGGGDQPGVVVALLIPIGVELSCQISRFELELDIEGDFIGDDVFPEGDCDVWGGRHYAIVQVSLAVDGGLVLLGFVQSDDAVLAGQAVVIFDAGGTLA